tara:strand:+ start:263 stop:1024 length:762 start_codon:yes stop_codon:yes gene_type:complete
MQSKPSALITGFSSGIGLAYAKHLASRGWDLHLVSFDESRAEMGLKELNYPNTNVYLHDLSKPESIKELTKIIPTPNLLVANAGITKYGEAGTLTSNEKLNLFYLLCNGVIDLIESYLPEMEKKDDARIIIISSIGAITPMPKSSIYAAAKSAIHSYGESLSRELKQKDISVTVSLPGYVRTKAHKRAGLDHLIKKVPSWMWIEADQVVKETEKASLKGKTIIIPGLVYKLVRPFLKMSMANSLWNRITRRGS